MAKRRILFKGVVLVALVLNLVPVPVMASPPFEARATVAASHSVAGVYTGFTDECVQLPWPGPRTTRTATMLVAGTSTLRQSAAAQPAAAGNAAVGFSVDDVAGVASAMLEPTQQHALTVTKTVDWSEIAPDAGQQFTICVEGPTHPISDCQSVGHTGGTLSWGGLTSGVYTVTETYPGDEWDVAITGSPVTFLDDGDATAAVTNTRRLGSLAVTKAVEWSEITPDAGQQFTICVEGPTYPISNCRSVGHTGDTLVWSDLRPGVYTVTETSPGSAWDVAITGSPATVPEDGGMASAAVTNTRRLGSLAVTKAVEWSEIAPDAGQQFTICVEGPTYPISNCRSVGHTGDTLVWSDMRPGVYTVTETSPGSMWDVAIMGSPATVPEDGGMASAAVTNTRRLGSLAVTKAVDWSEIAPDAGQQFTICVEGPTHPISNCRPVGHTGDTLVWSDLRPGVYTVTETSPGSMWDVAIAGSPATVPEDGGMASAAVTNTRRLGSLAVTKVVEWSEITPDAGQQFTICVEGPTYPISNCRSVGHTGDTLVWSDLRPGVYTVTETSPGDEWDVAIAGSPAAVPEDGGMASAAVTNTRKLGSLAVTKVVDWSEIAPDAGQQFTICIEGPTYPISNCRSVGHTGDTLVWGGLIPGDYTVSETDPGSMWDVAIAGSPAAVPEDGGMAIAGVMNTRKLGSLVVTKVVDWNGVPPDWRQHFTVCIEGPSHLSGNCHTFDYTGGTFPWNDLIPGDYTITEIDPGDEWEVTIVDSPATVPEDGGMASATVTNTRKLGSLAVTKVVDWQDIAPDVSQQFTICVEGPKYPTGDCQTFGYIGDTFSWDDLIPGDYTITEVDPGDEWFVQITGSPATVPADGGSASAVVTNTRQLGWVRVTKVVDWDRARPDASRQFTICIAGPSYPGGKCQTFGHSGGIFSWDELIPGDYVVTESDPGDSWDVVIEGSPATVPEDGTGVSVTISNHYGGSTIYLPLVASSFVASAPDLVVDDILVTSDSAQVVIRNQGDGPVLPADAFWVDLYVDPDPIPTTVNQTWENLCDQGIVWGVTAPALPLEPGGALTLTIGDVYHWESYSYFPGALPSGTPIYVQVDSADVQTTYGAVLERHEILGDPYNNISHVVYLGAVGTVERVVGVEQPVVGGRPSTLSRRLPPRP